MIFAVLQMRKLRHKGVQQRRGLGLPAPNTLGVSCLMWRTGRPRTRFSGDF